ncbi:GNAT family N-acetyltransferase [Actinoplanes subtropicus]|uniref:GNAT family N-acetyltransferase n=1 Tax=Actinoplanes subtropicus TaxID=543632 RepID=UPI0004C2E3C2|nr:GNAT family N-acetyltransferase [Actinoplanes subtropicus]
MPEIRPYRPSDLKAVYDICVRTADGGEDARGHYSDDDLVGDVFAGPYVRLEPELAFVIDDGGEAVGYVLGTADTEAFVRRYTAEWLPSLGDKYPAPPAPPRTASEEMIAVLYDPGRMLVPGLDLAAYPAHLHIDLLPVVQGRGYGRKLIERFTGALDVPGVHLGVRTTNVKARGFYARLGFEPLPVRDPGRTTYLGLRL